MSTTLAAPASLASAPSSGGTGSFTSDMLFALPPDKTVDRWIFRGELRESTMTKRNASHSECVATITGLFFIWVRSQPLPRPRIYSGEAYFRIRQNPDTNVGIDVALATPEQVARRRKKDTFVEGPPLIAVEVLSPYDKQREINETIEEYLDCGIAAVWIVEPYGETVAIYRPGRDPELLNRSNVIENQPELPGFHCPVAELFQ